MSALSRRALLWGSTALALSTLTACQGQGDNVLRLYLLNQSLPTRLVRNFQDQAAGAIQVQRETQLAEIATLLETWHQGEIPGNAWSWLPLIGRKRKPPGHLVTLGDAWLQRAIKAKWIQPLPLDTLSQWSQLPSPWQKLVQRNAEGEIDPNGQLWGAPYRSGTVLLVYHRQPFERLGWTPQDWSDLWRPELRDRVTAIDQPRDIIGLTLKKLGHSYNTPHLSQVPELEAELTALGAQIKFYSDKHYLQPVILKDAWIAVGWSTDIIPALVNYPELRAVIPQSGTSLWADLWVQPQGVENRETVSQWLDFCWQARSAQLISRFTDAISPIPAGWQATQTGDAQIRQVKFPAAEIMNRSEFLQPFPIATQEQYDMVWQKLRDRTA